MRILKAIAAIVLSGGAALLVAQTKDAGGRDLTSLTFAAIGTPSNGRLVYCSDCTQANPCAGSGAGAIARRENGAWNCGGGAGGGYRYHHVPLGGYLDTGSGFYWGVVVPPSAGITGNWTGSPAYTATVVFDGAGTPAIYTNWRIPADMNTGASVTFLATMYDHTGSGGSVKMAFGIKCFATGDALDTTFAATGDTGSQAFTGFQKIFNLSGVDITPPAACTAGAYATIKVSRDTSVGAGTAHSLINLTIRYTSTY